MRTCSLLDKSPMAQHMHYSQSCISFRVKEAAIRGAVGRSIPHCIVGCHLTSQAFPELFQSKRRQTSLEALPSHRTAIEPKPCEQHILCWSKEHTYRLLILILQALTQSLYLSVRQYVLYVEHNLKTDSSLFLRQRFSTLNC